MKAKKMPKKKKGLDLIRLLCSCGKRVKVSPKFAGKVGKCPKCGNPVQIPSLKIIEQKVKEIKGVNANQEVFEIPSLPELKQIELDGATDNQTKKDKAILQVGNKDFLETTGELEEFLSPSKNIELPDEQAAEGTENIPPFETPIQFSDSIAAEPIEEATMSPDDMIGSEINELQNFKESFAVEDMNEKFAQAVPLDAESEGFEQAFAIESKENEFAQAISMDSDSEDFAQAFETENTDETFEQAVPLDSQPYSPKTGTEITLEEVENDQVEIIEAEFFDEAQQQIPEAGTEITLEEVENNQVEIIEAEFFDEAQQNVLQEEEVIEEIEELDSDIVATKNNPEHIQSKPLSKSPLKKSFSLNLNESEIFQPIKGGEILQKGQASLVNKKYDEALLYLSQCIVLKQDLQGAYYLRAIVHVQQKQWLSAINDLEKARALDSSEIDVESLLNQVLFQQSLKFREIGAYDESLKYLDRIVNSHASIEKGKVYWMRAKSLIEQGIGKTALRDLEEAILHDYSQAELFESRGQIYMGQKDYESAMHDFTASIKRGAQNSKIFQGRSEAYFFLKNLDASLEDINKAIEFESENASLYDLQGLILSEKQQYQDADNAFERSLGLDPNNPIHYFNRAICYMRRGRYDKAIEDFTYVLELDPDDRLSYLKRAICYQEKRNPNLALAREDFKKVEELEQDSFYRSE